ncbi:unnamed protein product [Protopolystoma xenopodis]|uniref:Uncharacterized protein n=1 Tax=Protopolystoma xenopodis TaxID=117903 RepID=A0A448WN31_9PLAT|nr:unnamed protein product [Protopolystoma xenopodis]
MKVEFPIVKKEEHLKAFSFESDANLDIFRASPALHWESRPDHECQMETRRRIAALLPVTCRHRPTVHDWQP